MLCSVITKNSNWEILTRNLVTFKRYDGVKDKKTFWSSWKNLNFFFLRGWGGGGGFTKNH